MNNSFFALFRWLLKEKKLDLTLACFDYEPSHFYPLNDTTIDLNEFGGKILKLNWGHPLKFHLTSKNRINKFLNQFDFIIGCGTAPAFLSKVGKVLDIYVPYGSDLYTLPFANKEKKVLKRLLLTLFCKHQKTGIENSKMTFLDVTNNEFEKDVSEISISNRIFTNIPYLFFDEYKNLLPSNATNDILKDLEKLRTESDYLLVQPVRQVWKNPIDKWEIKGNDILFYAYKDLIDKYPSKKINLILFEYGIDVAESKSLLKELGIEDHVKWYPTLGRKDVMIVINQCDGVIGQLFRSWYTYGVVIETLFLSKTFIHHRNDDEYKSDSRVLYPMINAFDKVSCYNGLEMFFTDKEKFYAIGKDGNKWCREQFVKNPIEIILSMVNNEQS